MIYSCIVELIKDWLIPLGAIGVAIWIPKKIRWEQQYSSLLDEYRGFDYAIAYQGVVQFFCNDCGQDMSRIKPEHIKGQNKGLSQLYHLLKNSKKYLSSK